MATTHSVFADDERTQQARQQMVASQIRARGIQNPRVLTALQQIPRHFFVDTPDPVAAYDDHPLSIGYGQTISQPFIVAAMTELLEPKAHDRILEIGSGCGYQTAVLALLVDTVYSIEIIPALHIMAKQKCETLGFHNIHFVHGDGYQGLAEAAPFDGIIVAAAPTTVPEALTQQLKEGGRLVIPVGADLQNLCVYTKTGDTLSRREVFPVRFVPMTHPNDLT